MSRTEGPSTLMSLFSGFAMSSFATSAFMLWRPESAWGMYGAKNERRSITSICYASAIFGEGVLQLMVANYPSAFLGPAIVFMVPYKLVSSTSLALYSLTCEDKMEAKGARSVALQWFSTVVLIYAAIRMDSHEIKVTEA